MQKLQKIMMIGFLFIVVLAALPNQVNAAYSLVDYDDIGGINIDVLQADYLDYDGDDFEDDIITVFTVIPPTGEWSSNGKIRIECSITKPSGLRLVTELKVITVAGVEITLVWFNWADEPGDYILSIKAEVVSNSYDIGSSSIYHIFDPPGGKDDGIPEIAIMSIIELCI